jgi:hypothetical protein
MVIWQFAKQFQKLNLNPNKKAFFFFGQEMT